MKTFAGNLVLNGHTHLMSFAATNEEQALALGTKYDFAVNGETVPFAAVAVTAEPELPYYNLEDAVKRLGNVTRQTIYKWCVTGRLERIPGTRKILITRASLERMHRAV
jgi:hypothetical protein